MISLREQKIVTDFSAMPWQGWLHRRFSPLVTYLIMVGGTRAVFQTQGIDGEFPISLYDMDDWYSTPEMFRLAGDEARRYLQQKNIIALTRQCEERLTESRVQIQELFAAPGDPRADYARVIEIITPVNVYVWVAHSAEVYYHDILREAAGAYVPKDKVETFIGDISFPAKKNALALMEDGIRAGEDADRLHKKYAWVKARGGFQPGYTLDEIKEIREQVLHKPFEPRPELAVPEPLRQLVYEAQELVYLRTLRTDALWELYYLAQPIFERAATAFGVASVQDFIPNNLLNGATKPLPHAYAILKYYDDIVVTDSIIQSTVASATEIVKGVVAFRGKATGVVKILYTPQDIGKVAVGDVLVTNMTIPAYLSAMHRAVAFVTNEGGITCHAAILARELKKPCITGTKIATKIFKDGDVVEVDAEKGIVTKIK